MLFFDLSTLGDIGIGASLASKLRSLSSESFVQLLSAIFLIVRVCVLDYACLIFYFYFFGWTGCNFLLNCQHTACLYDCNE